MEGLDSVVVVVVVAVDDDAVIVVTAGLPTVLLLELHGKIH